MKLCDLNPGPGIGASAWHVEIDGCGLLMDSGTHPKREGRDALPLYDAVRERPVDTIAITQVKQLASALARSKGSDEREAASQLFGRLSLNLMRGNALMLASRAPDVDIPRTEVDGVE